MDIRAIEYASQNVKDDKDFIMKLVREDEHGIVLRHMGTRMKSDRDVVLAAVQKCGSSLQFASDELRSDMAIVLAAIRSSFHALVIFFRAACCCHTRPSCPFPHTLTVPFVFHNVWLTTRVELAGVCFRRAQK
jgi:hypothetical protein